MITFLCSLLLADYGADVVRIDRPDTAFGPPDTLCRRKRSIVIDLKSQASRAALLAITDIADVLIDPFRPQVLERLGLGPEVLCQRNPRLIYARLTGFRRDGLWGPRAGHDINYLAVSGVLGLLGRRDENPAPPVNILGDFAGGGAACAMGILLALLRRGVSGCGQVVEANMVDGTSYLATFPRQHLVTPNWNRPRGENLLDGAAPYYEVYKCKDGKFVAVGAQEPKFYNLLIAGLGLSKDTLPDRDDRDKNWPILKDVFSKRFAQKTQAEWREIFDEVDACVSPVLGMHEIESPFRPFVELSESPSLAVADQEPFPILPKGQGCKEILEEWLTHKSRAELRFVPGSKVLYMRDAARL